MERVDERPRQAVSDYLPFRRIAAAGLLGLVVPYALLPWAGGLILLPYFLLMPALTGLVLMPAHGSRNAYQVLGLTAAFAGAVAIGVWSLVRLMDSEGVWGTIVSAVVQFLLFSLVPGVIVILVSNRHPKAEAGGEG